MDGFHSLHGNSPAQWQTIHATHSSSCPKTWGHRASLVGKVISFATLSLEFPDKKETVMYNSHLVSQTAEESTRCSELGLRHQSELLYAECKPGLRLTEGREGRGRLKHSASRKATALSQR